MDTLATGIFHIYAQWYHLFLMEQYMMYRKALSFGDEKVATQILATDNAAEIKGSWTACIRL